MFKLFSVDDHLIEHANVWSDRLPEKHREAGPRIVEVDGQEYWTFEGQLGPNPAALGVAAGRPIPEWVAPAKFSEIIEGCYDPKARSQDLLANGVVASVGFPSLPRFAGVLFTNFQDKELADLCVRAYNDYVIEEWCPGGVPGMFVPMGICQIWDPELAAAEIRRNAERGARALSFPENTVPLGYPSFYTDHWDPIWRACEETETVISMHIGTSGQIPNPSPDATEVVGVVLMPGVGSQTALINLAFSPAPRKFPGLKFVFAESGIGWLPHAIERADAVWSRYLHSNWRSEGLDHIAPSEIWQKNMYLCQVEDQTGLAILDRIGAERVLWELDYPHPDTTWPHAQEAAGKMLTEWNVSRPDFDAITHQNAQRLFRWTPAELPTPALT